MKRIYVVCICYVNICICNYKPCSIGMFLTEEMSSRKYFENRNTMKFSIVIVTIRPDFCRDM